MFLNGSSQMNVKILENTRACINRKKKIIFAFVKEIINF